MRKTICTYSTFESELGNNVCINNPMFVCSRILGLVSVIPYWLFNSYFNCRSFLMQVTGWQSHLSSPIQPLSKRYCLVLVTYVFQSEVAVLKKRDVIL